MEFFAIFVALAVVFYVSHILAKPAPAISADFDTRHSQVALGVTADDAADRLATSGPTGAKLVDRQGTTLVFDQPRGPTALGAFYRVRLTPSADGGSQADIAMKTRTWEVGGKVTRAQEQFVDAVRAIAV